MKKKHKRNNSDLKQMKEIFAKVSLVSNAFYS